VIQQRHLLLNRFAARLIARRDGLDVGRQFPQPV